jgi:hypothetical protein
MQSQLEGMVLDERRRDLVRRRLAAQEAERARGVSWSGLGPGPLPPPTSEALLREAAGRRFADLESWRRSRPGRLVSALSRAQRAAEQACLAAETARAALARADGSANACCSSAAEVMEAQGRTLLAAARAARRALRVRPEQDRGDAC